MRINALKFALVTLGCGLLSTVPGFAQGVDNDGCTNMTLQGDYAFRLSGQILVPGGAPVQRDGVAMTSFDGHGNLKQVDFVMSNGTPVAGMADPLTGFHIGESGTYTVYPDCTGTAEIVFPTPPGFTSGAVIDLNMVIGNGGRIIHTIVSKLTPPGATIAVPASIHSDAEKLASR